MDYKLKYITAHSADIVDGFDRSILKVESVRNDEGVFQVRAAIDCILAARIVRSLSLERAITGVVAASRKGA